jgi:hypothetical protein
MAKHPHTGDIAQPACIWSTLDPLDTSSGSESGSTSPSRNSEHLGGWHKMSHDEETMAQADKYEKIFQEECACCGQPFPEIAAFFEEYETPIVSML